MWIAWSQDIIHWGHHGVLHGGGAEWETGRVGAGTPPIRVPEGWLEIYHGSRHTSTPGTVGKYSTGAMLLHIENPGRIVRRTTESIFEPTADFERHGFVPDVVFPTGIVETENTFLVYYGAADTCTGGRRVLSRGVDGGDGGGLRVGRPEAITTGSCSTLATSRPGPDRLGLWRSCWRSRTWRRG